MASEIKVDTIVNAGGDNDSGIDLATNDVVAVKTANTERMRVASDGKVGVGTTSGTGKLTVQDSSLPKIQANYQGTHHLEMGVGSSGCGFAMTTGHFMTFNHQPVSDAGTDTNLTERLKINASGDLYATNASTSTANLTLRKSAGDTIDYLQCRKTDNDLRIVLEGSGDVHNATGTFSAISDEKLKENIVDASSQWDDIKNIKIRNFSLKADKSSEANMIGVVAQEIEKVSPNLVKERIDTDPDTGEDLGTKTKIVKYSILHTKAVKALQEAMARIETLEAKVKELESK